MITFTRTINREMQEARKNEIQVVHLSDIHAVYHINGPISIIRVCADRAEYDRFPLDSARRKYFAGRRIDQLTTAYFQAGK